MRKALYYIAIAASFIAMIFLGTAICAALSLKGNVPMMVILLASISVSKFTASILKNRLLQRNPRKEIKE